MRDRLSQLDDSTTPISVTFPRIYNAAVDLVDRHLLPEHNRGSHIAYHDDFGSVTYAALSERVNRAGNALLNLGIQMEQRVLMAMLDTVDFVAMFLGAIKIGAVPVPVNTLLSASDYRHFLIDSRARLVVVSDALLPKFAEARAAAPQVPVVVARSPLGAGVDKGALLALDALMAQASSSLQAAATTPDDTAFWLYSSGSTGAPKGAMHLQSHLMMTAALYGRGVLDIRKEDVIYSAPKLFFAYGLGNALTFPLCVGATAVLMAERATPSAVARTLRSHQPSIFCGVPTLFASMLADPQITRESCSQALRVSLSAGEALPRHVGERWQQRFGSDILDGLGSTEMLHMFLSNRPGDVRYGTTGKAVPGYQLKLVGDDGDLVGDGEEGSLWVHGPTAAVGYFNNRERSLSTFHGPWTRTGDRFMRDASGYYICAGRSDDMLKVGGIWVSPVEVEGALSSHPAVLEAAVVGKPDEDGLIKPQAFVVLKDAAQAGEALSQELKLYIKDRLAPFKYPRWIEFVAELPKTATGKIQRFRLRG